MKHVLHAVYYVEVNVLVDAMAIVKPVAVEVVVELALPAVLDAQEAVAEIVLAHAEVIVIPVVMLDVSQLVLVIVLHLALQDVMEVQSLGVMDVIQNVLQQLMLTLNYKKVSYIINYIINLLFFINKKTRLIKLLNFIL